MTDHAQQTRRVVLHIEVLIVELRSVDTCRSSAIAVDEVTSLQDGKAISERRRASFWAALRT